MFNNKILNLGFISFEKSIKYNETLR